MKISKRKVKFRIIELLIIIITIVLTILAINYAEVRDVKGYGGEYLVPVFGFLSILIIEDLLKERRK